GSGPSNLPAGGRRNERGGAHAGAPSGRAAYAIRTRLARGPFGLCSTSNVTRSPPVSESKFSDVSMPVRWKKYSFPSSAAMTPNPRSDTTFLIVPWDIKKLPFSNFCPNARVCSRRKAQRPRRTRPLAGVLGILPNLGQSLPGTGQGVVEQAAHDAAA